MNPSEYVISRVNFRNGSFIIVTMMLSCAFIGTVLLFAYDFTTIANEQFAEKFWTAISLHTDFSSITKRPWTVLTYAFFDKSILSLFSSIFWIMVLGFFVEKKGFPSSSITIFLATSIISALAMSSLGSSMAISMDLTGARIPILGLAGAVLWSSTYDRIRIGSISIPVIILVILYLLLSIADIIMNGSYILATGYVTSFAVGVILSRPIRLVSRWDRKFTEIMDEKYENLNQF